MLRYLLWDFKFAYFFPQSVREDDNDSIKQWLAYIEVEERKRKGKPGYRKDDPRFDPTDLVPIIDRVDDYDPHYNAVHNAVITNNLDVLDMLQKAGAGSYNFVIIIIGYHVLCEISTLP